MDRPDAAQVRQWATGNDGSALFDFARYGYGAPDEGQPDALERPVASATAYVERMTGRTLNGSLTDPALVALAQDAVLMRVEQILVGRGNSKAVRDALGNAAVLSFRAGDYSETRRNTTDLRKSGMVNPWGELSDTLLALATEDKRAELLAELGGVTPPRGLVVETTDISGHGYDF